MNIVSQDRLFHSNLLPYDGIADYHGPVMSSEQAAGYLDRLRHETDWKHDEAVMFGKQITMSRKYALYADKPCCYMYAKVERKALPWLPVLRELKALVEQRSGETYNSCLLNLYHDGSEAMGWHSDAEKEMLQHGAIASLSLGAERKFSFKHRQTAETVSLQLDNGSLLVMHGAIQDHWLHCLPKSKRVHTPRINLTFRTIVDQS